MLDTIEISHYIFCRNFLKFHNIVSKNIQIDRHFDAPSDGVSQTEFVLRQISKFYISWDPYIQYYEALLDTIEISHYIFCRNFLKFHNIVLNNIQIDRYFDAPSDGVSQTEFVLRQISKFYIFWDPYIPYYEALLDNTEISC